MAGKTSVDGFASLLSSELKAYSNEVYEGMMDLTDEVTKNAKKELESQSPINQKSNRKHYRNKWKSKTTEKTSRGKVNTIYNDDAFLTHLTERGHQLRGGGRAAAQPHIAPVEQNVIKELETGAEKVIKNA